MVSFLFGNRTLILSDLRLKIIKFGFFKFWSDFGWNKR